MTKKAATKKTTTKKAKEKDPLDLKLEALKQELKKNQQTLVIVQNNIAQLIGAVKVLEDLKREKE